jgi:hypothetical protein
MGIPLSSSFTVNAALPLDDRVVTATLFTRDAILAGRRFQGMQVHCLADSKNYQLQGGIANVNWTEVGTGSGGGSGIQITINSFVGDAIQTVFTLTIAPLSNWVDVFISGVYQHKSTYSIAGTTLTFTTPPPDLTDIEVNMKVPTIYTALVLHTYVGDGLQTVFTLLVAPTNANFTSVYISGAYQNKNSYTVSGTTLTFSVAPPSTLDIEVMVIKNL